jgi:hypothetical protein
LYSLKKKIQEGRMGGVRETNGGEEKCIMDLVGKPEGKKPFERHGPRREDNI